MVCKSIEVGWIIYYFFYTAVNDFITRNTLKPYFINAIHWFDVYVESPTNWCDFWLMSDYGFWVKNDNDKA